MAGALCWQTYHLHVSIVLNSGSLTFLEPSGPVEASNEIALPLQIELYHHSCFLFFLVVLCLALIMTTMSIPIFITNFKSPYLQQHDEAESHMETEITFHNNRKVH